MGHSYTLLWVSSLEDGLAAEVVAAHAVEFNSRTESECCSVMWPGMKFHNLTENPCLYLEG